MGSSQQHNINVIVTQQGLDQVDSSMKNFASTSNTVVQSQDALSGAMGKTQGAALKTGQEFSNLTKEEQKNEKTSQSLGQAIKGSALQITAFASGIVSTIGQVISYQKASSSLERQHAILDRRWLTLGAAQKKLAAEIKAGTISKEQAAFQSQKLELQERALTSQTEILDAKDQQHSLTLVNIATTVLPTVLNAVGSLSSIYNSLKGTIDTVTTSTEAGSESFDGLGTAADTATTTGLIPTGKSILQMIPGVNKLGQALGLGKTDGLSGALTNNGAQLAEHNKFSNVFVNAFKSMGVAITNFASNIKIEMGNAHGTVDKIKAGFTSFFTQLGGGFTALGGHLKAAGTAIKGFGADILSVFSKNPILIVITAIAGAIVGLIFNIGGFRDRLNELGVTLGKMAPWAKPFLDILGFINEKFADVGNWIMGTNQLASATTAAGQAARKAADDFDTHFKAIQKSFIVSQDFAKFEGIIQNLKNVKTAIASMEVTTKSFGVTTIENLGAATNAFELFNSGIVKGVGPVDAKVKEIQKTFEDMRKETISLAEGEKILGVQLAELEGLLVNNIHTSQDKIKVEKESALATKGTSDAMTNAEKIISDYNMGLKVSEGVYDDFVKAYVQGNFKIIDAMGLTNEELVAMVERFKKDFPDGAVAVQKGGEVIIKSITDINKETQLAVKDMDTVFKDVSKTITDNLPPSLLQVQTAIHEMSQEELLAKDISKLAAEGITQDKAKLATAVLDLAKKYGLSGKEAEKALKDIQTETDNLTKTQDKANQKSDETLVKIQNLSQTRLEEQKAMQEQTKAAQDLVKELGIEVKVVGMSGDGLLKLVQIHDELANATTIAADNVGVWYAELQKTQAIEKQEILTLETLADTLGVEIPAAILSKGIPAIKAYIESVIGIGEGAKKAREEAIKAFNDLHNKAQSALSGVISDSLGEDGDDIKKAIKGIEKVGVSIMALDSQSAIIDVFLNDDDYTNKVMSLDEVYVKEYGEIANLSQEQGTVVGDKFIQSAIDALPKKAKGIGQNMEAIWTEIKSSAAPTDSGNVLIGKLAAALERKDLILAAMQQGVQNPVAKVMGLTDQDAAKLAKNIPANLASVLNQGKGSVEQAATISMYNPVTKKMEEIPAAADTAIAPVEGIFSTAFLKASVAATGQLNSLFASIYNGMTHLVTNTTEQLAKVLSAWNDHAMNVGVAVENIKLQIITLQQSFSDLSINIDTYTTSMTANIDNWLVKTSLGFNDYVIIIKAVQETFSQLSLNVDTYTTSLTANIDNWLIKTTAGFNDYVLVIQAVQKAFNDLTLAVKSNMTSMTTYIENWAKDSNTAFGTVNKGLLLVQTNVSSTLKVWEAALSSMSTKVGTFASACETAFGKVQKSAETATKAVQALQKAIDALKDKTVTITYKIVTVGSPPKNARFGGSSIGYARGGDSWIQDKPGRIGNMNVSEFGKPEMITVTPLSNPYDVKDKSINLGGRSSGGGSPVVVTGDLYVTVQTQSGETLANEVKPFLLKGFSGIT